MINIVTKFRLPTKNGTLSDIDFVGDTPHIGSSDIRYSDSDNDELMKLADELKAKSAKESK